MALKSKQPAKSAVASTKGGKSPVTRGASPHADMAIGTELGRNALSRERYEFLLRCIMGTIAALIISICALVYLGTREVQYRYFITSSEGRIGEIAAVNRPVQSVDEILNWSTQIATKAYSMSFSNYAQQLDDIKPNFTDAGWRGFEQALSRAGFIEKLLSGQFVTSAVPQKAPVIIAQGLVGNVYGWRLQIPLIVTFNSASSNTSQTITVEVTVVRRPETENPKGLGIAQIISK